MCTDICIKFYHLEVPIASDLGLCGGFGRVLWFPPPLTAQV